MNELQVENPELAGKAEEAEPPAGPAAHGFIPEDSRVNLQSRIRDKPIAPGSPWQNGFAERLIGSIRRECANHIVVLGEKHLRRVLKSYARYYNEVRTHRSLDKDAPISRPVQRVGGIISHALLGGLHHHYVRV
jgi:Integrase core domain